MEKGIEVILENRMDNTMNNDVETAVVQRV